MKLRFALVTVAIFLIVVAGVIGFYLTTAPKASQHIRVASVWSDRVDASAAHTFYVFELNISNSGVSAWQFKPALLLVISNNSQVYYADNSYNATTLIKESSVLQGSHIVGQVAFELPVDKVPLRLLYADQSAGVSLDAGKIPNVSSVASRFNYNVYLTINGTGPVVQAGGWGFGSMIMNGVIENNSRVFFTGQKVQVNLWFEYLKRPVDPATITIESVTAENGFQVLGVDKPVPFTMTGWGSQAGLVFLLRVPPGPHTGNIDLTVHVSA